MRRQIAIVFTCYSILAIGFVVSACNKKQVAPNGADLVGVYDLISVDGKRVPASISHDSVMLQVRSGKFTINTDGTCSSKTVFVPQSGEEIAREVTATYRKDGSKLTMQWRGAGKTVGTIEGNTFTMDNEGMVFVYNK